MVVRGSIIKNMRAILLLPKRSYHHRSRSVLGLNWIQRRVESALINIPTKNFLHPSNLAQSSGRLSHPLVSEAYNKEQGHDRGAIDGPQTPLLDLLESCLETLEDNVPRNLRERLRDDHDVEKVIYELMIAAGFQRLGHVLKWNTSTHAKQSEFIVHTSRSKAISIECKKRDPKDGYEKKSIGILAPASA
jgi:hypothetical protein